ncbi:MAG TPA: MFS transporter [Pararobbsia sp.]|nr:MFS transporter [Pararobbsia sp.]
MRAARSAFFVSLFLARLADQILLFLVPLVVFQTTHSASMSGLAFFIETLPRFGCFPLFGVLCDRFSPFRLMRISQTLRAVTCVAGVAGYGVWGGIGWLVAISAICGVLTSQGVVAREVMLPQVFKVMRFERVLALSQLADQLGTVLGPMVAAAMLVVMRWEFVVVATALVFLSADLSLALWRRVTRFAFELPHYDGERGHWAVPFHTALRHVARIPELRKVVLLASGENLVIGVTLATSAVMFTGVHHQSVQHYAWLQTAGAIATVTVLLWIAHTSWQARSFGVAAFIVIVSGGLLAGLSANVWGYAVGFVLITGFDKMFSVYIRSVRQKVIPSKDYGKTTGVVILLNNATQPLAGLLVGFCADRSKTGYLVAGLSLAMALIGAAAMWGHRLRGSRSGAAAS